MGDDGDVADFETFGWGDEEGGVEAGECSCGGRREVGAVFGPVLVEEFDAVLELFALFVGEVGVEEGGLIGEAVPRIGDRAAIAERGGEGAGGGAGLFPGAGGFFRGDVGLGGGLFRGREADGGEAGFGRDLVGLNGNPAWLLLAFIEPVELGESDEFSVVGLGGDLLVPFEAIGGGVMNRGSGEGGPID